MRKSLLIFLMIFTFSDVYPQVVKWRYIREIKFPDSDTSYTYPYLCALNKSGRLYVISSAATSAKAHNAIYYADSTDTRMKKVIDFYLNGDQDTLTGNVGALRGIAALHNDIIVNASVPYPRSKPNTVGTLYYYQNGDTSKVSKFGFYFPPSNPGHGTFHHGIAVTKDSFAIMGVAAGAAVPGPRPRFYNLTNLITSPVRGAWYAEADLEIGGAHSGGVDVIRDVAVIPGGNYNDSTTLFYTSRNSQSDANITGGIASWAGGSQIPNSTPGVAKYKSQRVADLTGFLSFSTNIPYGITVDNNARLWVAGTDTLKRWVKCFDITSGTFAKEKYELPSQTSSSKPDATGAPFQSPADVAVTADGLTAYVVDQYSRSVFVFKFTSATSVEKDGITPSLFTLDQNYPNPFNPSTLIGYTLPRAGNVKLVVTNILGKEVATLVNGYREAGIHNEQFTGAQLSSGVYFYTLMTEHGSLTKKMSLLK